MKPNQQQLFYELMEELRPVLKQIKHPELLGKLRFVLRFMIKRPELLEELRAVLQILEERPFLLMEEGRKLLTREEAADFFQVSNRTLFNWKKNKTLIPISVGARVYYRRSDIDELIERKGDNHECKLPLKSNCLKVE